MEKKIHGWIQGEMFAWMHEHVTHSDHFSIRSFVFGCVPSIVTVLFYDEGLHGAKLMRPWGKMLAEISASGFANAFEVRLLIPRSEWAKKVTLGHPAQVKLVTPSRNHDRFYKSVEPAIKLWDDMKTIFERAQSLDEINKALSKIVNIRMKERW